MSNNVEHEKLFDEICNKLNELSHHQEIDDSIEQSQSHVKVDALHGQLRKTQTDLIEAHHALQNKIKALDSASYSNSDLNSQLKKLSDQLEAERQNTSKLSQELARSLELNLKLQLEIQEAKAKAQTAYNEERKYSQHLEEKQKQLTKQLELIEALKDDAIEESKKAKEAFANQISDWEEKEHDWKINLQSKESEITELTTETARLTKEVSNHLIVISELNGTIQNLQSSIESQNLQINSDRNSLANLQNEMSNLHSQLNDKDNFIDNLQKQLITSEQSHRKQFELVQLDHAKELDLIKAETEQLHENFKAQLQIKQNELDSMASGLDDFEKQAQEQNKALKNLMEVAESKIVELKVAYDKKAIECQDYHSHLQQALAQVNILKQENSALKEYINKVNVLNQQQANQQQLPPRQLSI